MNDFEKLLSSISNHSIFVMDNTIAIDMYTPIDLSVANKKLKNIDLLNPEIFQTYVDAVLLENKAKIAFGGYLEKRGLYAQSDSFNVKGKAIRNIHLGIDFWTPAGTTVHTPIAARVHSFKNNAVKGDYGPTIILEHRVEGIVFYTLFGHLSLESISDLFIGKAFKAGDVIATLGTPDVNVNYAPHLHFQIIKDIKDYKGDHPGVSSLEDLAYYKNNCPDPKLLLRF